MNRPLTTRLAPLTAQAVDLHKGHHYFGVRFSPGVIPGFIDVLLRDLLPAHPGYYGEMVWILMMLEQWLQRHAPEWRLQG